jgi:hypothetical protein
MPDHDAYLLPTGEVVRLARDLTRGAWVVDFTLRGGQVVDAVRLTDAQAAARAAGRALEAAYPLGYRSEDAEP